jgi:pimeloyl-ACP methyl ester carboxylesterase
MISTNKDNLPNPKICIPGWNIKGEIFQKYYPGAIYFTPPLATTDTPYPEAVAALKKTIVAPVHLIGWSMGGQIAILFAAQYPKLVSKLTLISTAAVFSTDNAAKESFFKLCESDFLRAIKYFHRLLGPLSVEDSLLLKNNFINDQPSALRYLHELHARDLSREATRVFCPATIIHSQEDQIISFVQSKALAKAIPQAKTLYLPGNSHFPFHNDYAKIPHQN